LDVTVYPGADGAFLLYEDDGSSFAFKKGEWTGIRMAWNDARKTLSLSLAPGSRMSGKRDIRVKLGDTVKPVVFEGRALQCVFPK
jgi:alpha-D-xyloside xylohydrolase